MKKILIAEDDTFLAAAYRLKLAKSGFDVKLVKDGQEALNAVEEFTPDLLVLDLMMPVKDGYTTLQELRANPKHHALPILVASNLGQAEDIEKAKRLGATDFIIKSDIKLEDLVKKIHDLLP